MIYTITFNPALDYISQVENFEIGKINRTKTEKILPGGKGLNVSTVLKNLGIESTALGFIAGFTGEELKRSIEEKGIKTDFIKVEKGITRINVKISSNEETALNGNGPEITEEDINKLLEKIKEIIAEELGVEEEKVVESASFYDDLGADSLDLFEMVMSFEDQFGVKIPEEELENIKANPVEA